MLIAYAAVAVGAFALAELGYVLARWWLGG
jgi:hypothetical protein